MGGKIALRGRGVKNRVSEFVRLVDCGVATPGVPHDPSLYAPLLTLDQRIREHGVQLGLSVVPEVG